MERKTALAATVATIATVAFGSLAFATLGGSVLLGFGADDAASRSSVPVIVADGTVPGGTLVELTTPATDVAEPLAPNATAGQASGSRTPTNPAPAGTTATSPAGSTVTTAKSTATTAPATSAAPVTTPAPVTTAGRPKLYTVSGWSIPSNYLVPSKWWSKPIPDYPQGTYDKCTLEDDGWACEN